MCPCGHMSYQMLLGVLAVSSVMWPSANLKMCQPACEGHCWFWCLLFIICLTSRAAIRHLHDISIYLWTSCLVPQCGDLVGMTPVRQRRRCHCGRVTQWRFGWKGGGSKETASVGTYGDMLVLVEPYFDDLNSFLVRHVFFIITN